MKTSPAIQFIQSIESSWKGHELFAIWIVKILKPRVIVDLGFDRALSTISFAYRNCGNTWGIDWVDCNDYSEKVIAIDAAFHNISLALRMHYIKNLHLIVGPFKEVAQRWDREIDLLHIDGTHCYVHVKTQYEMWKRFLKKYSVILIHDVEEFAEETGRFFRELPMPKILFPQCKGLGIATYDTAFLKSTLAEWPESISVL